ncbi:unnamed protein product [Rhizoctonia solani]|uniref:Uncharacterized protein n=1 Tax=Rhizoctonia solani TaxID=456999 RepID=A0A8H3AVR6_9AGAM|nr:unnamed protein product [Rhizoctonia solani]
MACSKPDFWDTVVDIFPKPGTENEAGGLPMIDQIRSYFQNLDSVLLVYHLKRTKRFRRSDHIYAVFKLPEGADAFATEWWQWGEHHSLKVFYTMQRNPKLVDVLLRELKSELEFIPHIVGSDGAMEPARFRGPAFANPDTPESESSALPTFPGEEGDFKDACIDQVFRIMELEEMLEVLSMERDESAEEILELMKEARYHKEMLRRYRNQ